MFLVQQFRIVCGLKLGYEVWVWMQSCKKDLLKKEKMQNREIEGDEIFQ